MNEGYLLIFLPDLRESTETLTTIEYILMQWEKASR